MSKLRYYIADLHFFHEIMNTRMDCRGFADAVEMNEYIILKWNKKVQKNDEVVILGDLSWGSAEETNSLLKRLNGRLYLIRGNHDRFLKYQDMDLGRFEWVRPYEELSDNRRRVILCHYPIMFYNGQYRMDEKGNPKTYMLHGHVHDTRDQRLLEQFQDMTQASVTTDVQGVERHIPSHLINCFCMYSDYEPLTLDEWIVCDRRRRQESAGIDFLQ